MGIKTIQMDYAGQPNDLQPRRGVMITTDNLAAITTAGYLNNEPNTAGINFYPNDFIFVNYSAPFSGTVGGSTDLFKLSISNKIITMVSVATADVPVYVIGITPGTAADNKAVVLGASKTIDTINFSATSGLKIAGTAVTSSAADLNLSHNEVASVQTVSTTPASGSCAVQFQFKNAAGSNIAVVTGLQMYASNGSGVPGTPATSCAALTNGSVIEIQDGTLDFVATNATGQLGVTVTAAAGTYHLSFVLPNGNVVTSSAIVVNA